MESIPVAYVQRYVSTYLNINNPTPFELLKQVLLENENDLRSKFQNWWTLSTSASPSSASLLDFYKYANNASAAILDPPPSIFQSNSRPKPKPSLSMPSVKNVWAVMMIDNLEGQVARNSEMELVIQVLRYTPVCVTTYLAEMCDASEFNSPNINLLKDYFDEFYQYVTYEQLVSFYAAYVIRRAMDDNPNYQLH